MIREWHIQLVVMLIASTLFLLGSPATAMTWGWFSLLCGVLYFLFFIIWSGRMARRACENANGDYDAVESHQGYVAYLTSIILVGALGIGIGVWRVGELWGTSWLVIANVVSVFLMALTFILARFFHTGFSNAKYHWKLVYSFLIFYICTVATGSMFIFGNSPPGLGYVPKPSANAR